MSIIINTNISSLLGVTALNKNTSAMNQALERLSTGYRINSSKDDAAGSAISMSLRKEISSFDVAQNNTQMGQSMIDTANGALGNLSQMLQRLRDLTEQSINGTYGNDERKAMQIEVENLVSEMYRIKESTEFNGKQLFGTDAISPITEEEAIEQGYTIIKTAQQLKDSLVGNNAGCKVMLFADINLDDLETDGTGSNWTAVNNFQGILDGNGFTIFNLKINKEDSYNQGLIANSSGATIKNLGMENVDIRCQYNSGAIVGNANDSTKISNCEVSGSINGNNQIGGIVGQNDNSEISCCSTNIKITANDNTGGIAGNNINEASISKCFVSGKITANNFVGGLVGLNNNDSSISDSVSSTDVSANYHVGGLVGLNSNNSVIQNSGAKGNITSSGNSVGGLAGENSDNAKIINGLSSGKVSADGGIVGGLVGYNHSGATIDSSKTVSKVFGSGSVGGFLGKYETGTLTNNEYNSMINGGINPIGSGLDNPTEEQIKNNSALISLEDAMNIDKYQNSDQTFNLQVGINNDDNSIISVNTGFDMSAFNLNIATEYGARRALNKIDSMMSKITKKQTELGATSNILNSTIEYQQVQYVTKISTNSIIKDADFAEESSNYIKSQILQQTTSSLLSTANQNPNIALKLIGTNR